MEKSNHDTAIEKASGKGKLVLRNGELVPIESLQSESNYESDKDAKKRKEAVLERADKAASEVKAKSDSVEVLSSSKREVNESRRMKGLKALIKNKLHYDPNWGLEEVMEACKKEDLLDKEGKLAKADKSEDDEDEKVTPIEAKYRSDLQAKMMDEDIDFEMSASTEELEEMWESWVDGQEETPKEEMLRILKACDYELEEDLTEKELKEELEVFRAELVEVAKGLEVDFKGKTIEILYAEVLKAKDAAKDAGEDEIETPTPEVKEVSPPKPEVKEKDLSDKDKVLLNARKDDLIAKIKKLGNPKLKPNKAFGLPKLEAMWKENRKKI